LIEIEIPSTITTLSGHRVNIHITFVLRVENVVVLDRPALCFSLHVLTRCSVELNIIKIKSLGLLDPLLSPVVLKFSFLVAAES
jgi:hypothetical protein